MDRGKGFGEVGKRIRDQEGGKREGRRWKGGEEKKEEAGGQ